MPRYWTSSHAPGHCALALLLICACASQPSIHPEPSQDPMDVPKGVDYGSQVTVYPGALDALNRYISNVMVLAGLGDKPQGCSGVLIAADKVLTAAHCLCTIRQVTGSDKERIEARLDAAYLPGNRNARREQAGRVKAAWKRSLVNQAQAVADSSDCQRQARVVIISYVAETSTFIPSVYDGVAVITMVGYGPGETRYPTTRFGFRHFGESQITEIDRFASGSTRFFTAAQEPGGRELSRNYEGDSGGGGFSQENDTILVGIISARVDGQGAVFESVYPHVTWLRTYQN